MTAVSRLVCRVWVVDLLDVAAPESAPPRGGLLVVSNHVGAADPPISGAYMPRRDLYFMAKSDYFHSPLSRFFIVGYHGFPVVRGTADRAALRQAAGLLRQAHAGRGAAASPPGRGVPGPGGRGADPPGGHLGHRASPADRLGPAPPCAGPPPVRGRRPAAPGAPGRPAPGPPGDLGRPVLSCRGPQRGAPAPRRPGHPDPAPGPAADRYHERRSLRPAVAARGHGPARRVL